MNQTARPVGRLAMAIAMVLSTLAVGGPIVGRSLAAADAVSIDSATEYGNGTIEIVFNRSTDAVDWVDVYVDGADKGRISNPGSGVRIEVDAPGGDVTPNRNLTVVTQIDRGGNTDQVRRRKDIAVSATTINASDAAHRSVGNAAAVFQGEPIAFVSDGNTDVQVSVDERGGDTVFDQRTGTNSEVLVFESNLLTPQTSYRVQFGTPNVDEWFNVSGLGLTAQILDDERYLAQFAQVFIASADTGAVTVELLDGGGRVVDASVVTLGLDRQGVAILRPRSEGEYDIYVTHNRSGNVVFAGEVTFEETPAALGSPDLTASLGSDGVDPGVETTLPITIVNNGSVQVGNLFNPALTQRVTAARGLTVRVKERGRVPVSIHEGTRGISALAEGQSLRLDVPVSIDAGAAPGEYRVPVNVSYRYTSRIGPDGVETTETVRRDLNVTLTVDHAPTLVIQNVSSALQTDSAHTLSLELVNAGNAQASETRVSIGSLNPDLTLLGSVNTSRFVGSLAPGERRRVAVEAEASSDADVGSYPLEVRSTYTDSHGRTVQGSTRFVSVTPASGPGFKLENLSSTLTIGNDGELRGRITYTGDQQVRDAVAVLIDERRGMTVLERTSMLGSLAQNDTAGFAFPIQLSERAEPGEKQFTISVRYRTSDDERKESDTMDGRAAIADEPRAFQVETVHAAVVRGGAGFLNVSVQNAGSGNYTDVRGRLFLEGPVSSGDDTDTIDRLASGETTTLSFPLQASGGAMSKPYPVDLIVRYDDPEGVTQTAGAFRLSLPVSAPADTGGGGVPVVPIVGVILVVALAIGVLAYRRRRS